MSWHEARRKADIDDGTARSGLFTKLHLFVVAATEHGQSIHVSGSTGHIKNDPSKAMALVTTPEDYPVWRTKQPILIPRGAAYMYQFAVFNGGKFQRWEETSPRTINATMAEFKVEDEFSLSKEDQLSRMASFASGSGFSSSNSIPRPRSYESNDGDDVLDGGDDSKEALKAGSLEDKMVERMAQSYTEQAQSFLGSNNGRRSTLVDNMAGRQLILACFHLPVELKRDPATGGWAAQWNDSLIARSDDSVASEVKTRWVGTVSAGSGRVLHEMDKVQIRKVLLAMDCVPIFAPQELVDRAYLGFCKQQLWPSFHNVDMLDLSHPCWHPPVVVDNPELSWDQGTVQGHWEAYLELNRMFAAQVVALTTDKAMSPKGTVVWCHDYHVMLLPKMLVDLEAPLLAADSSLVRTKIIYFLHIPFSTPQIFRSLQYGGELLNGIIRSDVVGFHAFDHARHFLNACKRNLGLKFQTRAGGLLGVEFEGRTVSVVMRHVSIETQKIDRKMSECGGVGECQQLQAKHAGKTIVVGLDTCQRLSGVALKLLGFEKLLDEFEKWRGKLVLVQRCFRPRSRADDEARTSAELQLLVQRINAKHPGSVDYEEVDGSRLTSGKRFGLWMAADVLLNTSVREGINLHWFEYVYVKEKPGVIVASEFASTVAVLNGAMRINPFDITGWKNTLDEALCMKERDKIARRERDWAYVTTRPSALWTEQVIDDMFQADKAAAADADEVIFSEEGEGKGPGANVATGPSFSRLSPSRVVNVYRGSSRRVIVLDYGGTLQQSERLGKYIKDDINPCHKGRDLPPKTFAALQKLSNDPHNEIYVCSSLAYDALLQTFRGLPRIGLAAQNGLCYTLAADDTVTMARTTPGGGGSSTSGGGGEIGDGLGGSGGSSGALVAAATLALPTSHPQQVQPQPGASRTSTSSAAASTFSDSTGVVSGSVSGKGGGTFSTNGGTRTWFVPDFGMDWGVVKAIALPILNRFTGRTNGSSIRFREPSLAWSYYRCDPEEGVKQAQKLKAELEAALSPFNVQVEHGLGELEILPKFLHKGSFVRRVLELSVEAHGGLSPDMVLVIGDDVVDEKMFTAAFGHVAAQAAKPPPSRGYVKAAKAALPSRNDDAGSNAMPAGSSEDNNTNDLHVDASSCNSPANSKGGGGRVAADGDDDEEDDDDGINALSAAAEAMLDGPNYLPLSPSAGQHSAAEKAAEAAAAVDTRIFCCTVGKKPTVANCYVESVNDVEELLGALMQNA